MGSATPNPDAFDVKSVCIIGAGAGGLSFCKHLLAENRFPKIDIFEAMDCVGGVWNYTSNPSPWQTQIPQSNPHQPLEQPIFVRDLGDHRPTENIGHKLEFSTPMYDDLKTNIPKMLMQYSDLDFPSSSPLFPTRETVLEYLETYAGPVKHLIQFLTQVTDVRHMTDAESERDRWAVTRKHLITGIETTSIYDAVVAASGHYTVPYVPSILGLEAWVKAYPGTVTHSKTYRSKDAFFNKRCIVVGNAASGADIGSQILTVAQKPLFWSLRTESDTFGHDERVEVSAIAEFILEDRQVRFEDGRVENNIDAIVFCTGYFYSFPYLESLKPPLITDGRRTRGVYQHIFWTERPTLAFPLLGQKILPFPVSEFQGAVVARIWSNRIVIPSSNEMRKWEMDRVGELGDGTAFHCIGPNDPQYVRDLYDWAMTATEPFEGKGLKPWDDKFLWIRANFARIRLEYKNRQGAKTLEDMGWDFEEYKKKKESEIENLVESEHTQEQLVAHEGV